MKPAVRASPQGRLNRSRPHNNLLLSLPVQTSSTPRRFSRDLAFLRPMTLEIRTTVFLPILNKAVELVVELPLVTREIVTTPSRFLFNPSISTDTHPRLHQMDKAYIM